jgi:hypothetical protein
MKITNPKLQTKHNSQVPLIIKCFCGGPGGSFFKKRPLAAGGTTWHVGPII